MSRTYKHKNKALYKKEHIKWLKEPMYIPDPYYKYFNNYNWTCGAPSAWINTFMERPFRRKNKKACNNILKGDNYEFPFNHKKPFLYYW